MMYPGNDFTKDTGNMMMDMGKQIMDKLRSVSIDFSAIPQEDVQKLGDFMTQVFGTATPSLNQENAKKLVAALGLNGLEEGEMGTFKDNESIVVKIIARIKQALGINIYAWVGVPLASVMASVNPDNQGAAFAITLIGGWILLGIFAKVLSKLGYNQDGDVAGYGHYDPSTDIRNK